MQAQNEAARHRFQAPQNLNLIWPWVSIFPLLGPGPGATGLSSGGVCCREELCTAGVHVHLSGQPMEPARHPFHVSHGTGPGELTGEVPGAGAESRTTETWSQGNTAEPRLPA